MKPIYRFWGLGHGRLWLGRGNIVLATTQAYITYSLIRGKKFHFTIVILFSSSNSPDSCEGLWEERCTCVKSLMCVWRTVLCFRADYLAMCPGCPWWGVREAFSCKDHRAQLTVASENRVISLLEEVWRSAAADLGLAPQRCQGQDLPRFLLTVVTS